MLWDGADLKAKADDAKKVSHYSYSATIVIISSRGTTSIIRSESKTSRSWSAFVAVMSEQMNEYSIRSSWSRGSIRRFHPHLHFQMPLQGSLYNRRTQWQTIDRLSMFIFGNSPSCRILLGLVNICDLSRTHIQPKGICACIYYICISW